MAQQTNNIRNEVPRSPVRPFKVRRKDNNAQIKRSRVLEAEDSCAHDNGRNSSRPLGSEVVVRPLVRCSRSRSPRKMPSSFPVCVGHRSMDRCRCNLSQDRSDVREGGHSGSRSKSRERIQLSSPLGRQCNATRPREDGCASCDRGTSALRVSIHDNLVPSSSGDNMVNEAEVAENQEFLSSYPEIIDLIHQFNNLSKRTELLQ